MFEKNKKKKKCTAQLFDANLKRCILDNTFWWSLFLSPSPSLKLPFKVKIIQAYNQIILKQTTLLP